MIEKTIAKRYAEALLVEAESAGAVEEIERQILEAAKLWSASRELRIAATHPGLPLERRRTALKRVFAGRVHDLLIGFLDLLVRRRRIDLLPEVAEAFDRLADRSRGVVKVRVRTAAPLPAPQRAALENQLVRRLERKIELTEEVAPSLLGGLAVRIGDTVWDGTLAGRLRHLREWLETVEGATPRGTSP